MRPSAIRRTGSCVGSDIWTTGTSPSGYMIVSGTQAPWSSPRDVCWWTGSVAGIMAAIRWASQVASGVS